MICMLNVCACVILFRALSILSANRLQASAFLCRCEVSALNMDVYRDNAKSEVIVYDELAHMRTRDMHQCQKIEVKTEENITEKKRIHEAQKRLLSTAPNCTSRGQSQNR